MSKPNLVSAVVPYIDATGRNVMVAIAKATWQIAGDTLVPSPKQAPIQYVDVHVDDDPLLDMWLPSDLTDFKPSAEVVVVRPRCPIDVVPFAGQTIAVQVGELSFAGEAVEPWPFGPLRRSCDSRLQFAGTYDESWQQERMPLLPRDFDPRYHQVAPESQTLSRFLAGDEQVSITGLLPEGARTSFRLPGMTVLVSGSVRQHYFSKTATLDTILIWSEVPALTLVWRHVIPTRQKIAEVGSVAVSLIRVSTARSLYE